MKTLLALGILLVPVSVFASDSCETDCPSGQVRVSYADGNSVTCACVEESSGMHATEPQDFIGDPVEGDA
jgi:hypothetical protein